MGFPEKYWWAVLLVIPVIVALIRVLPAIIDVFKRIIQKDRVASGEDKIHVEIPVLLLQLKQLYDEACRLKEDGAYNDALKKLGELTSIQDDYVNAYIMRGRIYLEKLKQYQNAIDEFRKGLYKDPHNKYLLYDLGLAYYNLGDLKQAINWNQKALNQDPDLIIAIYNHALYHVDCGKKYNDDTYYHKAIEFYKNVIERDQEFVTWAMFNLAALYARLTKHEKTKSTRHQYVKKAVELLDRSIEKEGTERHKKVTGEISVLYGEDLKAICQQRDYKTMLKKWRDRFTK